MSEPVKHVNETDAFYHALYHLVTHWAAYIAMLALLLTMAFLLSLTPITGDNVHSRIGVIALINGAGLVGCLYFVLGVNAFAEDVSKRLPASYVKRVRRTRHSQLPILLGVLCSLAAAALNWWLLYKSWK
jgi:hypothetical protein